MPLALGGNVAVRLSAKPGAPAPIALSPPVCKLSLAMLPPVTRGRHGQRAHITSTHFARVCLCVCVLVHVCQALRS